MVYSKRSYERKKVEVEIHCSLSIIKHFSLIDISQSGALVSTPENLKMGSKYAMHFKCDDSDAIAVSAKVIRSVLMPPRTNEEGVNEPVYEIGFSFIAPDKDDLKKLLSFIVHEEESAS